MARGLCETCAHYTCHRVRDGRGNWKTVREGCEVLAGSVKKSCEMWMAAIAKYDVDAGAVKECSAYAAEGETELPTRGGPNV